jgi:hypothetical protein
MGREDGVQTGDEKETAAVHVEGDYAKKVPARSLVLFPQGAVWIYPLLRASTEIKWSFQACLYSYQKGYPLLVPLRPSSEALLRARAPGARDQHGYPFPTPYVSIISSRASNSCPQAVQRMQSDSTVNSSERIPIPPQSEQRASCTR